MIARPAAAVTPPAGATTTASDWQVICALEDIIPGTGVCALVRGEQVAVFRVGKGAEIFALSNFDPFSKVFVLSRGIVGDRGGIPKVASPIYKQSFDLRTGACLDDPNVVVPVFAARVRDGKVEVEVPAAGSLQARMSS